MPAAGQQPATAAAVVRIVHQSMACLILLSNLPLATGNVGNTSVYQNMLETIMKENTITDLKLTNICAAICTTWASCFGHLKPSEQPRKGMFYYQELKGKGRTDERPALALKHSTIPLSRTKVLLQNTRSSSSNKKPLPLAIAAGNALSAIAIVVDRRKRVPVWQHLLLIS